MAFTATITAVKRSDTQLTVEVNFADSASGFSQPKVFDFDETATRQVIEAEITRVGTRFKQALTAHAGLQNRVGTVITI